MRYNQPVPSIDPEDKRRWEGDGWCVVPDVIPPDHLAAAQAALPDVFPSAEDFAADRDPDRNRPFRVDSHLVLPRFPFERGAFNRLAVHDAIIDLAEALLESTDIRLYQGLLSAKYSDGALDDEQLLHVDYGNHTLVVPRADRGFRQVEFFVYLSDVTPGSAATRMVPRPMTAGIPVNRMYLSPTEYSDLYDAEVPASGRAGSVLAYRPDVYHRGTRIEAPGSARFMLHVSFKPPDTDWLGSQSLPAAGEDMAWNRFMQHTNVRQLRVLGFPEPGHRYWTEETLAGVAARYPFLDMAPWRDAWRGDGPSVATP